MKEPTKDTLRRGYREWLVNQAKLEVGTGCARLRRVRDEIAVLFEQATLGWSESQLLRAMESAIQLAWRDPSTRPTDSATLEKTFPLSLFWTPSEKLSDLRRRARAGEFKIDKKRLRAMLIERLEPILGVGVPMGPLRFAIHVEGVTLFTDIDLAPRAPATVSYEQLVVQGAVGHRAVGYADDPVLLAGVSFMNLLGATTTNWAFITNKDLASVVDEIAEHCGTFLRAIPGIVEIARRSDR